MSDIDHLGIVVPDGELERQIAVLVFGLPDDTPWKDIPLFTQNIADAWLVVEKMRERGWYCDIQIRPDGGNSVSFVKYSPQTLEYNADESTLPLAICKAALAAVDPSVGARVRGVQDRLSGCDQEPPPATGGAIMTTKVPTPTPRTDAAELDNSHFSDWGTGPSGYVQRSDMEKLETELAEARELLQEAAFRVWGFDNNADRSLKKEVRQFLSREGK